MSTVFYGDLKLQYVQTREFRMDDELESSGVDAKYVGGTLTIRFVVTPKDFGGGDFFPAQYNETPSQTLLRLRQTLLTPRQHLQYVVADTILLDIVPPDQMYGPIPQYCEVVLEHGFGAHWTAQQQNQNPANCIQPAWVLEIQWKFSIMDCVCGQNRPFLTLRWSQEVSIDEKGYSTLTTNGRATINPQALQGIPADRLRESLIPPVIDTFYREAKFVISESNLEFSFVLTDRQRLYNPPFDQNENQLTRFTGRADLTSNPGGTATATISIELTGKKGASKSDMVRLGLVILGQKMDRFRPQKGGKRSDYAATLKIEEDLDDDKVRLVLKTIKAQIELKNNGVDAFLVANVTQRFGTPGAAIGQVALAVGSRGDAMLLLIGAATGVPCTCAPVPGPRTGDRFGGLTLLPNAVFVPELPDPPQESLSSGWDKAEGVWDVCVVEVTTDEDSGRMILPISGTLPGTFGGSLGGGGQGGSNPGDNTTGMQVVAVRLHNPVVTRLFSLSSEKIGSPPAMPAFESKVPGIVPMSRTLVSNGQEQTADGAVRYTQTVAYRYLYLNASLATAASPLLPWQDPTLTTDMVVFGTTVDQDLIDPAFSGQGSPFPPYT